MKNENQRFYYKSRKRSKHITEASVYTVNAVNTMALELLGINEKINDEIQLIADAKNRLHVTESTLLEQQKSNSKIILNLKKILGQEGE